MDFPHSKVACRYGHEEASRSRSEEVMIQSFRKGKNNEGLAGGKENEGFLWGRRDNGSGKDRSFQEI